MNTETMRTEQISIGGKDYYLLFNNTAMFALRKLCGNEIVKSTTENDNASLETLFKAISICVEQGELVRRKLNYDKGDFLSANEIEQLSCPADLPRLRLALYRAVTAGYGREIEKNDEKVDLVLKEIQKKTENR